MNRTLAPTKIALGQVFLLLGVLTCAKLLGFIPDQDECIIAGRVAVCEAVAMNSAELVGRDEMKRLESTLARVVDRSPGMLSAGVRRRGGSLVAQVADHGANWQPLAEDRSNDVQIQVPISIGEQRWGRVEFCFEPLAYTGKHAWLVNPWLLHTVFVLAATYVVFSLYIGKKLGALAPEKKTASCRVSSVLASLADDPPSAAEEPDLGVASRHVPVAPMREYLDVSNERVPRHDEMTHAGSNVPAVTRTSHRSESQSPIVSNLPVDDPVFREIVQGFVESLGLKIIELHEAWRRRDLQEVARLAHWIRGSGGTVGFNDFAHPSATLQEVAQQGNLAEVERVIAEIICLYHAHRPFSDRCRTRRRPGLGRALSYRTYTGYRLLRRVAARQRPSHLMQSAPCKRGPSGCSA